MSKRNRLPLLAALAIVLAAVLLVPACWWRVVGWARGEAFCRGGPTSYWRGVLLQARERRSILSRPSLWTQLRARFGHQGSLSELGIYELACAIDEAVDDTGRRVFDESGPPVPGLDVLVSDPSAVGVLAELLADKSPYLRRDAARALGEIGPPARATAPALVAGLGDKDLFVRLNAAWALGRVGPNAEVVVPALVVALGDQEPAVRASAARALAGIDPKAARAAGVE